MGVMSYLRSRAGLVIFVIGLAIVAFLLGDLINYGSPFWMRSQQQVGSINGNSIDYHEFNHQVDQTVNMYQQQMGGATPQIRSFAVQQVWNQFLSKELLAQEVEKLGLTVAREELNALVHGDEPSMQIMQAFTNPETGTFDREYLSSFISQISSSSVDPMMKMQWEDLLNNIRDERLNEKYANLIGNSIYVTSLEANAEYDNKNKLAKFHYVYLDYASIKDSEINLKDADFEEYYKNNKNKFFNSEESRDIEFVTFNAQPTAADTAATLSEVQQIKSEFESSTNDSLFVNVHSENKYPVTYYRSGQLSDGLDSLLFKADKGTIVGPVLSNGTYELAKVLDSKVGPDSVKASHILLDPLAAGGRDKAMAQADSIRQLILNGDSFSALAVEYSIDEGSKVNGGELPTFPRGQMIPEFENAAFDGKKGDIVVVESQFGVHIVRIEDQIGQSKVVKAAVVDKVIHSSKATTDNAYTKANQFFSAINKDNFKEVADKQELHIQKAPSTTAMSDNLAATTAPRELIRWAFEAKPGDVSDQIYETEEYFIVARMVNVKPKGIQPLKSIKSEIEPEVKQMVKARMLKEKLNNALNGSKNIQEVAQKVDKSAVEVENVVFSNPVIPGLSLEYAVVGTVFGLQPNQPSKAIEGNNGVFAVEVDSFVNPDNLTEPQLSNEKQQKRQALRQQSFNSIFTALQNAAKIDDNRIRFY